MASQETLINECRALCIDGTATRENIWAKCSTLGQHWVRIVCAIVAGLIY